MSHHLEERACAFPDCDVRFVPTRRTQKYHTQKEGILAANRLRSAARETLEDVLKPVPPGSSYQAARPAKREHPAGWEPGVALAGDRGTITTRPTEDRDPRWDEHLRSWGFDPDEYEVVEPIQVRTWEAVVAAGDVRQLWYHRADIRRRSHTGPQDDELAAIRAEIQSHRPKKRPPAAPGALVVALSDWQLGKRDGDGTAGIVERVLRTIDDVGVRIEELRRIGRPVGTLYLVGLGDLVEGCGEHYPMQTFTVELDRREQVKVARRLLIRTLRDLAPRADRVVVTCVAGNHGENRRGGKSYTTLGDNDDVAVFEQVYDAVVEAPAYGHVSFVIPTDDLVVTLDVAGTIVAFAHGHQARGGGGLSAARLARWWRDQQHAQRPAGDASVLVTGHYHHFEAVQEGPRTWFQAPALDGGSIWFDETRGGGSPAGTLTFRVGPDGWSDLAILGREGCGSTRNGSHDDGSPAATPPSPKRPRRRTRRKPSSKTSTTS